jgi:hypothetical protein
MTSATRAFRVERDTPLISATKSRYARHRQVAVERRVLRQVAEAPTGLERL